MKPAQRAFPFARGSHTSYKAGLAALAQRAPKTRLYLYALADHGPLTDHEAFAVLRRQVLLAPTGIQSIRNNAMDCLLVRKRSETRTSPYGAACHPYELTEAGVAAVATLRTLPAPKAQSSEPGAVSSQVAAQEAHP
jgi:hypothetical protein